MEQVLSREEALMEADSWEGYRAALSWAVDNVCPLTPIGRQGRAVEWSPPTPTPRQWDQVPELRSSTREGVRMLEKDRADVATSMGSKTGKTSL